MSSVFLSHSSTNNAEAVAIRNWLAAEGWNEVFLDLDPERGIAAGERWERALNEAASRCEAVLFLVSRIGSRRAGASRNSTSHTRLNKRLFGPLVKTFLFPICHCRSVHDSWGASAPSRLRQWSKAKPGVSVKDV